MPQGFQPQTPIEVLEAAYAEHRSFSAASKSIGMDRRAFTRRLRKHWKKIGHHNEDHDIPNFAPGTGRKIVRVSKTLDKDGNAKQFFVKEEAEGSEDQFVEALGKTKRVSTLRGADGEIRAQWEITVDDNDDFGKVLMEVVEGFKEEIPRVAPVNPPQLTFGSNLHNLYVLSDAHIGGLAWDKESGADWDLKIAEEMLVKAFGAMIVQSAPSKSCTIALLGDWMHYDKFEAVTTLSGNVLDSDGRQPKMNKVAIKVARQVVAMALQAHDKIEVLVAEGNHDIIAANWLRELFIVAFEDEPRVHIIDDPRPYYATLHGEVLLCFHHGHLKGASKMKTAEDLVALFADEYRELWGQAKKVYIHTGHFHFATESEPRGARVMQHPTLATRDSWAARRGWNSMREARGSTYHMRYGLTGTTNIAPEMLEEI